jgi:hypothetical protein
MVSVIKVSGKATCNHLYMAVLENVPLLGLPPFWFWYLTMSVLKKVFARCPDQLEYIRWWKGMQLTETNVAGRYTRVTIVMIRTTMASFSIFRLSVSILFVA